MSKPPREFVPSTKSGRVALFTASLGAIAVGSTYLSMWLERPGYYSYDVHTGSRKIDLVLMIPQLSVVFVYIGPLLGLGCLGLIWSIAMPHWINSRHCRSLADLSLQIWATTMVIFAGALAVGWWYTRYR